MMKTKNFIAIDLDGVVFDFEKEFCEKFGNDNRHLFDLHRRYEKVDRGLIDEFIRTPATYINLEPIFGGIVFINTAKHFGLGILLLTSRPKGTEEITKQELAKYNIQYDELVFAKDKKAAIEDYNKFYPDRPIKMLLDDHIGYLKDVPAGVVGIAWEQPWNAGYFPKIRYNSKDMEIEIKSDTVSNWKPFWRR